MKNEKKILLPLDGSDVSLKAAFLAKSVAVLLDMVIEVLYVSDESLSKEEFVNKTKINKEDLTRCIFTHKKGDPTEVIIEESKSSEYVIMSSHGEGYDPNKISGSVATKVIESVSTPVLLVRPNVSITKSNGLWEPKNVLIPLNGTPSASPALEPAMKILTKVGAQLDLLHISVSSPGERHEPGLFTVPFYEDYSQHEWPAWSKEFLRRFGPALKNNLKIEFYVSTGDPGEEIINFSKNHNNDLIAMAWHGNFVPPHATTLRRVMFEAPCPVLLTKISQEY